jgi:hypothetical protein
LRTGFSSIGVKSRRPAAVANIWRSDGGCILPGGNALRKLKRHPSCQGTRSRCRDVS